MIYGIASMMVCLSPGRSCGLSVRPCAVLSILLCAAESLDDLGLLLGVPLPPWFFVLYGAPPIIGTAARSFVQQYVNRVNEWKRLRINLFVSVA